MARRQVSDEASRARLFGKRSALVVCGVVATWFIFASLAQIIPAVFGTGFVPLAQGAAGSPERVCAEGLRRAGGLAPASDAPSAAAAGPTDPAEPALAACTESPAGLDALAALHRLQMAEEQLGRRDPGALSTLRLELSAHLPAEMR
jgi:hypothetical protein